MILNLDADEIRAVKRFLAMSYDFLNTLSSSSSCSSIKIMNGGRPENWIFGV